jgi:peptide/nickel transport system permease protein
VEVAKMRIPPIIVMMFRNKKFLAGFTTLLIVILLGVIGPIVYPVDPFETTGPSESPPNPKYPLGTDLYGRDILAQFLQGIRNSLYVGFITAIVAVAIGLIIGTTSAVLGGRADSVLMGFTNIVMAIPSYFLALIIAATTPVRTLELVGLFIGITSWPWFARAIRAQLLSLKEREYIYLSRMAGYGWLKIAFTDLLPGVASYTVMATIIFMGIGIGGEAFLTMIGLGPSRVSTIGIMLFWAFSMEAHRRGVWWWWVPPGMIMILILTALYLMNMGLDEVFNPRLRRG